MLNPACTKNNNLCYNRSPTPLNMVVNPHKPGDTQQPWLVCEWRSTVWTNPQLPHWQLLHFTKALRVKVLVSTSVRREWLGISKRLVKSSLTSGTVLHFWTSHLDNRQGCSTKLSSIMQHQSSTTIDHPQVNGHLSLDHCSALSDH